MELVHLLNPFDTQPMTLETPPPISVGSYSGVPNGRQPGDVLAAGALPDIGTRIYESAIREIDNVTHLVFAQMVGIHRNPDGTGDMAIAARWYDLDISDPDNPELIQAGTVNPSPETTDTYLPAVDIAADGTIGMNFLQSARNSDDPNASDYNTGQYMAMYVTSHRPTDPNGYMLPPTLVRQSGVVDPDSRIGDFSSTCVDPSDGTFWAVNQYYVNENNNNVTNFEWSTWIQHFQAATTSGTPPQLLSSDNMGSDRTNNALATFTGTKASGDSITLFDGTTLVGTYTLSGTSWAITATVPLATNAQHHLVAVTTSSSGTISYSSMLTVTVLARGDVNLDNHRNSTDIGALDTALTDLNAYYAQSGLTSVDAILILDINQDGNIDNGDIQALEELLIGGGGY